MEINKTAGRYKLNEEDKAKQVPLRLSSDYLERLGYLPGSNNSERIRNLIDNCSDWLLREQKQIKEVKRMIGPLYKVAKALMSDPELKSDKALWKRKKEAFFDGYKSFTNLLNLYHFDLKVLKRYLTEREVIEVDIVFNASAYLEK